MPDSDNDSGGPSNAGGGEFSSPREQERFLPIANVSRIMKKSLPANAKISKDAKETVQECVSEFISFITGEASDKCQREKRKTVNGDDLLWAMTTLGFEDYVEPLKLYLQKFRELEGEKGTGSNTGGGSGGGSSSTQQKDASDAGGTLGIGGNTGIMGNNGSGGFSNPAVYYGLSGAAAPGGMMTMMGQPLYGSPAGSAAGSYAQQQHLMGGRFGGAGGDGNGGSSSSSGLGRQDRI